MRVTGGQRVVADLRALAALLEVFIDVTHHLPGG